MHAYELARERGGGGQIGGGHRADGEGVVAHARRIVRRAGMAKRVASIRRDCPTPRRAACAIAAFSRLKRASHRLCHRGTPVAKWRPDEDARLRCLLRHGLTRRRAARSRDRRRVRRMLRAADRAHRRHRSPHGALGLDGRRRCSGIRSATAVTPPSSRGCCPCAPARSIELSNDAFFTALDASTQPVVYAPADLRRHVRLRSHRMRQPARPSRTGASGAPGAGQVQIVSQSVVGPYETRDAARDRSRARSAIG